MTKLTSIATLLFSSLTAFLVALGERRYTYCLNSTSFSSGLSFVRNLFVIIFFFSFFSFHLSGQTTVVSQVSGGNDDAEEELATGNMNTTSTDLELISDGGTNQLVGIRFSNIYVPQGTTILSASIQFTTDETDSGSTSVTIFGEDADNAVTFSTTNSDISSRTLTTASVAWNSIPSWNTVGETGANQQTPDLTTVVQEIVNRGGWTAGNAMSFVISGSGERTAESYNGVSASAPILTIVASFSYDPLPTIVSNPNRGLPFIYFMADNRAELYAVAPDPTASPLPTPTITSTTFGGSPIIFTGEGGAYRSSDRQVYVFQGGEPTSSSDMYSIDPATGVATLVKTGIVAGHVEGAEFWINNTTGEELLVIVYQNGTSGGANRIMAINPNVSGSLAAWTPYAGYPVTLSGARTTADGISWNPDTNEFYVQNDDTVDYYTVNINTGVTTFAYTTSLAVDGEGITYAADGQNYIEDEGQAGQGRTIFVVDTNTGVLTPAAQLGSTGDVESIMGNLAVRNDAGDAPSSYGYAAHVLPLLTATPSSIYLGTVPPDSENPFVNFSIGNSDDNSGDDEDGVTLGGSDLSGQLLEVNTIETLTITTNGIGVLNAWIDFNRDGDFDDVGEQIASDVSPTAGSITLNVVVPATASLGTSYARFRYSSETGLLSGNTEASDGEVEDYQVILNDSTICPSGTALVSEIVITSVYATAVILDDSVGNETNALGSDDTTTADLNNSGDELILEMGESINLGDSVTVNGEDGDDLDIWVSSSATGPWTQVGVNAQLDFTFTSPINWLYIRFERGDNSGTENLSYIDASKTSITTSCEVDTDGDGVADINDLDDDNDGVPDIDEVNGNEPDGDEDGDGILNFEDTTDNGNGGDGSTTNYTDSNGDGIPDVYDTDSDGVTNHLDLDSDNDGIYDAVEAGHNQAHTDGVISGPYGANGLADSVETSLESGLINYSLADSDSDATYDPYELDADNDGCNDVNEAGYTDDNSDGLLGDSPLTVDANGLVTSGSDGYTAPVDGDSNGTFDFREVGSGPTITVQSVDTTVFDGANTSFSITASGSNLTYQWQVSSDGGTTFSDLSNGGIYSNTTTTTLNITGATLAIDTYQYQVVVNNSAYICDVATSMPVTIIVIPTTDTDNDGIYDVNDLDDDNDGILDVDESDSISYLNSGFPTDLTDWTSTNVDHSANGYPFVDVNCTSASLSQASPCLYPRVVSFSFDIGWNNGNSGCTPSGSSTLLDVSLAGTTYLSIRTPNDGGTNNDNASDQGGDALVSSSSGATFVIASPSVQGSQYIDHSPYTNWTFTTITVTLPKETLDASILFDWTALADDIAIDNIVINGFCGIDSDGDLIPDYLEIDSDNDGCVDAIEAGFTDPDSDGVLGTSPVSVDSNGLVTGQGGYTAPADLDLNGIDDFQEVGPDSNGNGTADGCEADLELTKIVDNATPNIGDIITFTITVVNNGPNQATSIQVRDILPVGLTITLVTPSVGTYTPGTGIWDLGTTIMSPTDTQTLTIAAEITPLCGTITNIAEIISSSTADADSVPNNGG